MQELHAAVCMCSEPVMELLQLQDNHHAFFIGGLVKEVHEGMAVNRVLNQRLLTCLSATESTCATGNERRLLSARSGLWKLIEADAQRRVID